METKLGFTFMDTSVDKTAECRALTISVLSMEDGYTPQNLEA